MDYWALWQLIVTTLLLTDVTYAAEWGYTESNGPANWPTTSCQDGTMQSPIDIPHLSSLPEENSWAPFRLIHYDDRPYETELVNNGHTAVLSVLPRECNAHPQFIGSRFEKKYQFAQLHFHWGSHNSAGSEHTLNGHQYAAEMHLVHFNTECGRTITEALKNCPTDSDTLAVLGVFIEVGQKDNEHYEPITRALSSITEDGASTHIHLENLRDLLPDDIDRYVAYEGGLTSPNCNEIVQWSVLLEPIKLSHDQIKQFWKLKTSDGTPLIDNFRPTLDINGRDVTFVDVSYEMEKHCHHDHWKKNAYFHWGETHMEAGLVEASHLCMGHQFHGASMIGLMPIGKLRHFRNQFGFHPDVERTADDKFCFSRFFRVNAIKDANHVWREYPGGSLVNFHHFPEFRPEHGGVGDTLIWDAHLNKLYIDDKDKEYHALCYMEYDDGNKCPGFEIGHECVDAGDCHENTCKCDTGFYGYNCQQTPLPEKDIVSLGGAYTESSDTISNSSCTIDNYNTFSSGVVSDIMSDYVFGRGIACGGTTTDPSVVKTCGFYDCFTRSWQRIGDLKKKLTASRSAVIRMDHRDKYWWVTGGRVNDVAQTTTWTLDEDMNWEMGPTLPVERADHCVVQINEKEAAIIGGVEGSDNSAGGTTRIDIYNFHTHQWRRGPDTLENRELAACGVIKDMSNYHNMVIIACSVDSDTVEVWDTRTNEVYLSDFTCPTGKLGQFDNIDDQRLAFTNLDGSSTSIFVFDMFSGFSPSSDTFNSDHDSSGAFVAPRGYIDCVAYDVE